MPLFVLYFFFFSLANMGFPGTSNFIGEFFIFIGLFDINYFFGILVSFSIILSAIYSLWFYNRLVFG